MNIMRIKFITVIIIGMFLVACKAGIDPAASLNGGGAITISFSGLDGSGTADDPAKIEKGTSIQFSVTDSNGNPVDVTWGVSGISSNISMVESVQLDESADCGSFSGNTYTAPSSISGSGECLIRATASADPLSTGSIYTRTTVGDAITYTSIPAYSVSDGYTVSGGAIAVSEGIANVVVSSSSFNTSTGIGNETFLGTYQTDISSSFDSFPAALPIFDDVVGLPTPLTSSESYVHFTIDSNGRCYYLEEIDTKVPAFYVSDDCSDLSSIVWNGPYYVIDSGVTIYNYSPIITEDFSVDADGYVHFLWADPRYRGTTQTSVDSPNADVFYDRCSRASDGSYSCSTDTCLTCDLADGVGKPYDVHVEVYGSGASARVNGFWVAGVFDTYTSSCDWSTTTCASGSNRTFSTPAVIDDSNNIGMMQATMDSSDGRLYVVGNRNAGPMIIVNYSTDGGGSFTSVTVLELGAYNSSSIYANDSEAYIVAIKDTLAAIGFTKSTDGGATWSAVSDIDITGDEISDDTGSVPFITGDGTNLYILYWADDETTARLIVSSDDGATWSSPTTISIGEQDIIMQPSIKMAPVTGGVYIPLGAMTAGDVCQGGCAPRDPYLTYCTSAGVCQTPVVVGVQAKQEPYMFPLSFNGANASSYGMLWSDGRNGNYDIYFASTSFGANPSGSGTRIASANSDEISPIGVVGPDGAIHAVWYMQDSDTGDNDIYYSKSTDSGATWASPVKLNSGQFSSIEESNFPTAIAVGSDGSVHVVWSDDSITDLHEVFYVEYTNGAWSDVTNITSAVSTTDIAFSVAVDNSENVYVLYESTNVIDSAEIYVAKKSSGGAFASQKIADGYALFDDDNSIVVANQID